MSKIKISGNASGTGVVTLTAPNTNTDRTITLPDDTQTLIGTNASGNVGIGTSSPSGKLDVVGDIKTSGEYVINSGTTAKWTLGQSSDALYFYSVAAGTERMRVLPTGGITFNGDTAAANALDDYEEGTFTCTLTGDVTGSVITAATAKYTKIGDLVTYEIEFFNINTAGFTGRIKFTGLPFVNGGGRSISSVSSHYGISYAGDLFGMQPASLTYVDIYQTNSASAWSPPSHTAASNVYYMVSGTYKI